MAVTLEHIYLSLQKKYDMKLEAGVQGIKTIVDWVHIVESEELIPFLHKRELVITTGISNMTDEMLLDFCIKLQQKGISGCIVNIGPHIAAIPKTVCQFCDDNKFPLLTLPWEVHLVDVIHEACRYIFVEEQMEEDIAGQFKDGLLLPERRKESEAALMRNGFPQNTRYCIIALTLSKGDIQERELNELYLLVEKLTSPISGHYILFVEDEAVILATADFKEQEIKEIVSRYSKIGKVNGKGVYCAVGPICIGLSEAAKYYAKVKPFLKLMVKKGEGTMWYDEIGLYKLLLGIDDKSTMADYCGNTVGRLISYDVMNHTHYYELLVQYLEKNGCIKELAESNFIHRNTVTYQLKKIEKILEVDLENWGECMKLYLSILIHDFL